MLIEVYVCPHPGCGNYYGTSGMPDMTVRNQHTHGINFEQIPEDQWHSRAQCPACRAAGRQIERVKIPFVVNDELLQSYAGTAVDATEASVKSTP